MGDLLNNITLSNEMLVRLYGRSLVQPGPAGGDAPDSERTAAAFSADHPALPGASPATVSNAAALQQPDLPPPRIRDAEQRSPVTADPLAADSSTPTAADLPATAQASAEAGSAKQLDKGNAQPVKFLGSNEKKVLLLVNNTETAFLPEEQLTLVTKILKACELNLGDVAIVNLTGGSELPAILTALQPRKLISFGALEPAPGLPFPLQSKDGAEWLMAPSLESLQQETGRNPPLKTGLWQAMRQLFDIPAKK